LKENNGEEKKKIMPRNVTIHKIMVEEYVPKREPIHPFLMAILYFLLFYISDLIVGMYQ
jgi:hypothetical protein